VELRGFEVLQNRLQCWKLTPRSLGRFGTLRSGIPKNRSFEPLQNPDLRRCHFEYRRYRQKNCSFKKIEDPGVRTLFALTEIFEPLEGLGGVARRLSQSPAVQA
jgi:hypothetical protein